MIRTGLGVDVHELAAGDGIILGGVHIPCQKSIVGHSDGDVVIHAIVDALLGAIADGDIGTHFPSSDPKWKGASSRLFLEDIHQKVIAAGGEIQHVDCTIILQEPALSPFIPDMRRLIAEDLHLEVGQVSIKATTTDHLGFIGREEGLAALAVATLSVEPQ